MARNTLTCAPNRTSGCGCRRDSVLLKQPVAWLVVAVACLIGAAPSFSQTDAGDAPTEVTILKHGWSVDRRFTSKVKARRQSANDESMSQITISSVAVVSVKVRNNTTKTITGVTWYLVLIKASSEEELARMRFSSQTEIKAKKTAMVRGRVERWPRTPRAVTVDELKTEVVGPAKERVQISCLLFADGSFSSLNESSTSDCHSLVAPTKAQ